MVLCHFNRVLSSDEDDPVYIKGERRVFLTDDVFTFDLFKGQIRQVEVELSLLSLCTP